VVEEMDVEKQVVVEMEILQEKTVASPLSH
jgi:hypothetical protein